MTTATMRLIETVERLNMTGEIGDGTVARLHELAGLARLEQNPADVLQAHAERNGRTVPGYEALRAAAAELVPMRHRCGTCGVVDGHAAGCVENEGCRHPWHDYSCPNSWGSICPGCGEAG